MFFKRKEAVKTIEFNHAYEEFQNNMIQNISWKQFAVHASRSLNLVSDKIINQVLLELADEAVEQTEMILTENAKDLEAMEKSNPMYDRLLLTKERIEGIAADIRNVASLPSPLGKVMLDTIRPNGIKITKVSVPFGVVGIIYEARPNVSFDVFSLCFKSGNTCVLKGGSDAFNSNRAIVELIKNVLRKHELDENTVILLPAGREAAAELRQAHVFQQFVHLGGNPVSGPAGHFERKSDVVAHGHVRKQGIALEHRMHRAFFRRHQ